jgi:ABC-type branched-subunit amino acid transport system substrate-binding protein
LESASVLVELSHTLEQLNTSTTLDLKNKLVLLGSHSMYEHEMLVDSGKFIDNLVLAVPWFSHLIKSQNFVRDAQALWKEDISWRTATSYDAAQSFIAAIRALQSQNKISSELIQEYLENLNLSASLTSGNSLRFVDNESESNREPITVRVKSKLEAKLENSIQFQLESQRD